MGSPLRRFRFPRSMRLTRAREFKAVYDTRLRVAAGPLVVHGAPVELTHSRLGLSVSRRVGGAVVRNRIKRRLREAFRQLRRELPASYDLVVAVRPHEPLSVRGYAESLLIAVKKLHERCSRRANHLRPTAPPKGPDETGSRCGS